MNNAETFWSYFNQKQFDLAQKAFDQIDAKEKQVVLAALFQQSQNLQKPHSVSVLFRKVHENKTFKDFYEAWLPPKTVCDKVIEGNVTYQQFFPAPIRVINAANLNDPKDIVSIGLHWITDEQLAHAMSDPKMAKDGAARGDKISEVADEKQTGIYRVLEDDNLGTPF